MCTATAAKIHPFEMANLGKAPFFFDGMEEKVYVACPGAPAQPGSTCDYCGQGIRYVCWIKSSDGKSFKVGCDCVLKLNRESNRKATKTVEDARLEAEVRRAKTKADNAKKWERVRKAFELLDSSPDLQAKFAAKPHPSRQVAKDVTYLDYIGFCRKYAGLSGSLAIAKIIEQEAT